MATKKKLGKKQAVWETENPRSRHEKLTPKEKAKAERSAKEHGRSKPGLVDNINAKKRTRKKTEKKGGKRSS